MASEPTVERPVFARTFPKEPRLDRALAFFNAGNYQSARREAQALLKDETENAELRSSARELLRRMEPDPLAKALVAIAFVLLVVLAGYYWTQPHAH
ncbi:MAG: hypothetical protein IPK82_18075 [Polyangiaceae bacterium]|nr:hypothetical protein [Polyangiaceae bacterium]